MKISPNISYSMKTFLKNIKNKKLSKKFLETCTRVNSLEEVNFIR